MLFVKVIKPKHYDNLMIFTSAITIIFLCIMLLNCNFVTIVLYNLFQTISKGLTDLINERNVSNFSNISAIKKELKVEYFLSIEPSLFIGRVISNILFIFMAFTNAQFIMSIFVIFVVMRAITSIMLQSLMKKCDEVNLSDEEILQRWTDKTSTGIQIGSSNKEEDLKDCVS